MTLSIALTGESRTRLLGEHLVLESNAWNGAGRGLAALLTETQCAGVAPSL
jgi:hypothetical protein